LVGLDGANAAWLLVQHADHDVAFQKDILELMEPLVAQGEAAANDYALLYDRVAINEKRLQRYGSQGRCNAAKQWEPWPIEDAAQVDKRRADVGLQPLDEYVKSNDELYCP
jgi:hypothetical protein